MRTSFIAALVIPIAVALLAGCGEVDQTTPTPKPTTAAAVAAGSDADGSTWGEELASLRPAAASITWHEWTLPLNEWGNIQERRVMTGAALDEYDELVVLERLGDANPKEASLWPTVFTLSTATDMVHVEVDGTRTIEAGEMSPAQIRYSEDAYDTYMRQAYAYSRGNLKPGLIRRDPLEPFTGEYDVDIFYWPAEDLDLGRDLERMSFDSMNAIWFPEPVRPHSRGATTGGWNWGYFSGQTSTQLAPGREAGKRISDVAHITLHEWLHQTAHMRWQLGYFGLPGQYDAGNYNAGSHLYYQHYIITPRMWRAMHRRDAHQAAPNKPKLRSAGYLLDWLICGQFEGNDRDAIARDVVHQVWTNIQIQGRALTPEEKSFPESEAILLPDEGDELMGNTWVRHTPTRDLFKQDAYDEELDMVFLRRDGNRGAFPVPRKNVFAYASTYVWSPEDQDAVVWAGCMTPFKLYLNAEECLRSGRGTAQDEAVRNVRLRTGWNRVLVLTTDQAEEHWYFSVKFTDRDRNDLPGLKVSATRPPELDPDAILTADDAEPSVPPIETTYYSWEGDVADDWWGALPILNEQHFEALFGQKGVRIDGSRDLGRPVPGPDRSGHDKTILIDVSAIADIRSRVAAERDSYDYLLNNLINHSIETTALIRYTHPETGKSRDLLFVRIDMVEPFIELIEVADPRPLRDSIIGTIMRDTKQAVVFETYLGEPLPANELALLTVRDADLALRAWPSVPRVVRGQPLMLNLEASYVPAQAGHAINLENIELRLERRLRAETADTVRTGDVYTRSLVNLLPGETLTMEAPIDTTALPAGVVNYTGSISYTRDGTPHVLERPVPVHVLDPVSVTLNIDGSSLLTSPHATACVVVHNNLSTRARGTLRLELPEGWTASPATERFTLDEQDDETRVEFELTLPPDAASTTHVLRAVAEVGAATGVTSQAAHQVQVALGDALVHEDFEHAIPSDFAHPHGLYKVELARDEYDVPIAFKGSTCLKVQDGGGSRYGYVRMFGTDRFWPAGRRKPHTTYTYDTNDYPIVEWWMRSDGRDANLGVHVRLDTDRGQQYYGVLLHGLWEQHWDFSRRLDTVDFPTDRRWHKITINLDELLDNYLGNEPHIVRELRFGDTRVFASGWWFAPHKYRHYIDEFSIRKARPDEQYAQAKDVLSLEGEDRPPAFESRTPTDGLLLTVRPRDVSTTQSDEILLDGWYASTGIAPLSVPGRPADGSVAVKLVDENGKDVFDDQPDGWLLLSPPKRRPDRDADREPRPVILLELKPGESVRWTSRRDGALRIDETITDYMKSKGLEPLVPAGRYTLTARVIHGAPDKPELEPTGWQGEIVSNTVNLIIEPSPTKDELLAQLESPYPRDRARAVTALWKGNHVDTLPTIVKTLDDADATVRLNAVCAIAEFAGSDPSRPSGPSRDAADEAQAPRLSDELKAALEPTVAPLIKALGDDNWRVGEYAGFALAEIGDPRGIEPLTEQLENDSPWIRHRAADALAEYQLYMPVDPTDEGGRNVAVQAALEAFDRLVAATDNEMPSTRLHALQAARRFVGRPTGADENNAVARDAFVPVIRKAFGDPCWSLRAEAAKAAAEWPEADFSEELTAMLTDLDWVAREALAKALGELGNKRGDLAVNTARAEAEAKGETLSDEQVSTIALEAKQPQIDMLTKLLSDERIEVRWAAVQALHGLKTGKSIEELTGHDANSWRVQTN